MFDPTKIERNALKEENDPEDEYTLSEFYHPRGQFDNPLKNFQTGMSNNWMNNLVPNGATHKIATSESLAVGTAKIVDEAWKNWMNHRFNSDTLFRPTQLTAKKIGLTQEIVRRITKGAYGEIMAVKKFNGEFTDWKDDKEGVDFEKGNSTYQVKTGKNFSSHWKNYSADHLVWVELNDDYEIIKIHKNPKE